MMNDDNFKIVIPEIDSGSALKLCRGNKKIYIQSLRLFVSNIPATLEKMRGVTENNLKDYITSVHSLKGMCDYTGALEIRKTAKQLEDIADAGDYYGILERNETLIKQTEKIIHNIQKWLYDNSNFIDKIINTEQKNG